MIKFAKPLYDLKIYDGDSDVDESISEMSKRMKEIIDNIDMIFNSTTNGQSEHEFMASGLSDEPLGTVIIKSDTPEFTFAIEELLNSPLKEIKSILKKLVSGLTQDDIVKFYELEYKISRLRIKNEDHPKLYMWEAKLGQVCDKIIKYFISVLYAHIESNYGNDYLFDSIINAFDNVEKAVEFAGRLPENIDEDEIQQRLNKISPDAELEGDGGWMLFDSARLILKAKKALKSSLKNKIIMSNEAIQWWHAGGSVVDHWEQEGIIPEFFDDLSNGKFVPKWDKELAKIH